MGFFLFGGMMKRIRNIFGILLVAFAIGQGQTEGYFEILYSDTGKALLGTRRQEHDTTVFQQAVGVGLPAAQVFDSTFMAKNAHVLGGLKVDGVFRAGSGIFDTALDTTYTFAVSDLESQNNFLDLAKAGKKYFLTLDTTAISTWANLSDTSKYVEYADTTALIAMQWELDGKIGGSGTANTIPKFTATRTLGNSNITDGSYTLGPASATHRLRYRPTASNRGHVEIVPNGAWPTEVDLYHTDVVADGTNYGGYGYYTDATTGLTFFKFDAGSVSLPSLFSFSGAVSVVQTISASNFSGSSSGTNTGDVSLSGTPDYITISGQTITRGLINLTTDVTGDLPYANLTPSSTASKLLGRGSASAGDWQEITIGTGLSMSGTTLSATGSGGITSLNGLTASSQTFADVDDTNVTLAISSVTSTHTLTLGWTGTLAAGRGGTGNAFFAVSGPATSVKTYTFPNSNSTIWANTNDGAGSGLDADLLDGNSSAAFATSGHTHTLSGDVTGTVTGAVTIANNAVTLAKMQDIATASFLGRNTAATGDPEVLSTATAKTMLNLAGTNTGDQTITLSGDATGSGTAGITVAVVDNSHNHTGATISALDAGDITTGILSAARGGTNNGFFQVSGPATTAKTYTFPNSSTTVWTAANDGAGSTLDADLLDGISSASFVQTTRTLTMTGTAGQVNITGGTQNLSADRTWTFSLPQSISGSSSPTFAGLNITGTAINLNLWSIAPGGDILSGTYTPTITNVTNVTSSTAFQCQYMQVGTTVHVSGIVDIDPTNASQTTQISISLPIASNFGAIEDLAGVSTSNLTQFMTGFIRASIANDRADLFFHSVNAGVFTHYFTFTYQVI